MGASPGRDPYFRHLYRVDWTERSLALLTPEDGPTRRVDLTLGGFITDSYSKPDVPPVACCATQQATR